jgi:transposase-like protein
MYSGLIRLRQIESVKGHGTQFDRKMNDAVAAVLTQRNIEEAARTVGISTATLMRWMKEVEFEKASGGDPARAETATPWRSVSRLHSSQAHGRSR